MRPLRTLLLATVLLVGCASERLPPMGDNEPPLADAGPNLTAHVGETVQIDGTASRDPDGDSLTYAWTLSAPPGSGATLSNGAYATPSFVPDVPGDYQLVLVVNDGLLDSVPDDVVVTVTSVAQPANEAPTAVATAPGEVVVGTRVNLDGTASSDPEGDPITYDWLIEGRPDGSGANLSDATSPTPSFTPDLPGTYEISLVVRDTESASAPSPLLVVATPRPNRAPTADAGPDRAVATGESVELDGTGSHDPESDALSFAWTLTAFPAGSSARLVDADSPAPTLTPDRDGLYRVELVVHDGEHASAPDTVEVTAVTGNVPPNAHAGADATYETGTRVTLDGSGSYDPEGQALEYRWSIIGQPMNSNVQLADPLTATPSFTPSAVGTFEIQLVVSDGELNSAPDTVTVTTVSPNGRPTAEAGPNVEARVLDTVTLDASGSSDPDSDPLTFSWTLTGLPAGSTATLTDANRAAASFEPDLPGSYTATLTVRDGRLEASDTVRIDVLHPLPQIEGDLVITEVMANPSALADPQGEWFEVYNPTSSSWDLRDCTLTDLDGDYAVIETSLVAAPMSYLTLARSATPGFGPDYVYSGLILGNEGDEIILTCASSEIANVLFLAAAPDGASLALRRDSIDEVLNDDESRWCAATADYNGDKGTPGAPNEHLASCP